MSRMLACLTLIFSTAGVLGACAPTIADVRLFQAKPPVPYRVLGLVNGMGPNEASAMQAMMQNAANLGANGAIVQSNRMLGRQHVIAAQAIQYQGQLPPPQAAPQGGAMVEPSSAPPQAPPQAPF